MGGGGGGCHSYTWKHVAIEHLYRVGTTWKSNFTGNAVVTVVYTSQAYVRARIRGQRSSQVGSWSRAHTHAHTHTHTNTHKHTHTHRAGTSLKLGITTQTGLGVQKSRPSSWRKIIVFPRPMPMTLGGLDVLEIAVCGPENCLSLPQMV